MKRAMGVKAETKDSVCESAREGKIANGKWHITIIYVYIVCALKKKNRYVFNEDVCRGARQTLDVSNPYGVNEFNERGAEMNEKKKRIRTQAR